MARWSRARRRKPRSISSPISDLGFDAADGGLMELGQRDLEAPRTGPAKLVDAGPDEQSMEPGLESGRDRGGSAGHANRASAPLGRHPWPGPVSGDQWAAPSSREVEAAARRAKASRSPPLARTTRSRSTASPASWAQSCDRARLIWRSALEFFSLFVQTSTSSSSGKRVAAWRRGRHESRLRVAPRPLGGRSSHH
jgi:hypothetical protein